MVKPNQASPKFFTIMKEVEMLDEELKKKSLTSQTQRSLKKRLNLRDNSFTQIKLNRGITIL